MDPQMAYKLLYGGYNLIEYEERLAGMDDASLRSELQKAKDALSFVLHSDHAILTVSGERDAIRMMQSLVQERLSRFEPMGEPIAYADVLSDETGNTAFTIDTNVSYNLEYMSMDQMDIKYTGALSAFINLAEDQVLMPLLRYENSVYSVMFQMDEDRVMLMTYRDPNLVKTYSEIYPVLGDKLREALEFLTQDELDGYIASAYTTEAMPSGVLSRAGLAIQSALEHKDYFAEKLENMKSLKALTVDDVFEYAEIFDLLYNNGLKVTVTSPQKLEEAGDMFERVNADFLG